MTQHDSNDEGHRVMSDNERWWWIPSLEDRVVLKGEDPSSNDVEQGSLTSISADDEVVVRWDCGDYAELHKDELDLLPSLVAPNERMQVLAASFGIDWDALRGTKNHESERGA